MDKMNDLSESFKQEDIDMLFPKSKITDTTQLANTAQANATNYLSAGKILFNQIKDNPNLNIPCATVAALSCELFLKSIHFKNMTQHKEIKGHNLEKLFKDLHDDDKNEILNRIKPNDPNNYFEVFLSENKEVFPELRYFYEEGRSDWFNPRLLVLFAQVLHDYTITLNV